MKRTAFTCAKMQDLGELCGGIVVARGIMESLWHLTARETPHGNIGKLTDKQISRGIGWTGNAGELIGWLVECRWLDRSDEHRLIVHDWSEHCDDATDSVVARSGRTFADGTPAKGRRLTIKEREKLGVPTAGPRRAPGVPPACPLPEPCLSHSHSHSQSLAIPSPAAAGESVPSLVVTDTISRTAVPSGWKPAEWADMTKAVAEWGRMPKPVGRGRSGVQPVLTLAEWGTLANRATEWAKPPTNGDPALPIELAGRAVREAAGSGIEFIAPARVAKCIENRLRDWSVDPPREYTRAPPPTAGPTHADLVRRLQAIDPEGFNWAAVIAAKNLKPTMTDDELKARLAE